MLNADELARFAMENFIATKWAACVVKGGPHDLVPMFDIHWASDHVVASLPGVDDENVDEALRSLLKPDEAPLFVVFLSDAVMREVPAVLAPSIRPGDLMEMRDEGDLSILDVLCVVVIDCTEPSLVTTNIPYTYSDEGRPVFGAAVTSAIALPVVSRMLDVLGLET